MSTSEMQEPFLRDLVASFRATHARIVKKFYAEPQCDPGEIIEGELKGLYHGILVMFDGGTVLADQGLIRIIDEHGVAFDRNLHESYLKYWPNS